MSLYKYMGIYISISFSSYRRREYELWWGSFNNALKASNAVVIDYHRLRRCDGF